MLLTSSEIAMKIFCCLLLVAVSQCYPHVEEWESFKQTHGKTYNSLDEETHRMSVFHKNKEMIEEHNKKFEQGLVSYSLKMNHFGDLLQHEFKAMMNGYDKSMFTKNNLLSNFESSNNTLPDSIDWRAKGAVTGVKNQWLCGGCWAFSATGSLEGQHFLKTGKLVSLSEQQLIDCSRSYGNKGCFGGAMQYAFNYINKNGGIDTESSYRYIGLGLWCRYKASKVGATNTGYVAIPEGDEEALKQAVGIIGPVSVAIDASLLTFQFYFGGIYNDMLCSSSNLDHGVLVVGYGSENGQDYWLVKNSWGTWWGEKGYIRIARNSNNKCGVATQAVYPTV